MNETLTELTDLTETFEREGYAVARGLFTPDEVARYRDHYMDLRAAGTYPGDFGGVDQTSSDPLKRFPRMIHMHRWDELSLQWLLNARLRDALTTLMGTEPYAVQTMLYFKPAGARGQALHQDNFYLKVQPGTCIAAWLALDKCDEENGCMRVVPGSHQLPVLCTAKADTTQSFTDVTVPVPEDLPVVPVHMEAGDVLFFGGSLIHGSYPNTSSDRFRRSLIGHYVAGEAEKVGQFYQPLLRFDGTEAALPISPGDAPCGVWAEENGTRTVRLTAPKTALPDLHE
jgi:phytanoyl-CoA hydroxylase